MMGVKISSPVVLMEKWSLVVTWLARDILMVSIGIGVLEGHH